MAAAAGCKPAAGVRSFRCSGCFERLGFPWQAAIKRLVDDCGCSLVVTTGIALRKPKRSCRHPACSETA